MLIIFLLASLAFAIGAWYSLEKALIFAVFALPLYQWRAVFGVPVTFLEIMILVSFVVWFIKNYLILAKNLKKSWHDGGPGKRAYPFGRELSLVLLSALIAAGVARFSNASLGIYKAYFLEPALFFIVIFNVFGPKNNWRQIFYALSTSGALVSLTTWWQKFINPTWHNPIWGMASEWRAVGIYDYPNAVGLYVAPMIALTGVLAVEEYKKRRYSWVALWSSIIILDLGAIYFAKTEAAIIGLAVSAIVILFLQGKKCIIAALSILMISFATISLYAPAKNFFIEKITLSDLSGEIRKQQWRETWQMLGDSQRWLWGAGLSNYQEAVAPYHQPGIFFNSENDSDFRRKIVIFDEKYKQDHWQPVATYMYPHNWFLNFWTELGLFGMILFTWVVVKYLVISGRLANLKKQPEYYGLFAAMLIMLVHSLADVQYFKNDLSVLFWILLAMIGIAIVQERNKKSA